ncbi:MAG: tetratricopeptide repeat protein [Bacteroidetes bacterium]|nr:tetratricopeptide repeat protein [Bacteroidota bacterium]
MEYFKKALEYSIITGNRKMEGYISGNISIAYAQKFEYDSALYYDKRALEIDIERKDKQHEAIVLNNIGLDYRELFDYPKALGYFLKSLKINKEIKSENIGTAIYYIGIIYQDIHDYKNALKYGLEADKILGKIGNKYVQSANYGQLGETYLCLSDYNKALECFKKGYLLNLEVGNKQSAATLVGNVGKVYALKKKYDEAFRYFRKALKDSKEIDDKFTMATTMLYMGSTYADIKDYKHAVEYGEKAVKLSREINDLQVLHNALEGLSLSYEKMNHSDKALLVFKEAKKVGDSILNTDKQKEITRKQMQFDFDMKQVSIKAAQDKRDAIAKEVRGREKLQRNALIAGAVFLLLLSCILFFNYRENVKKNIVLNAKNTAIEIRDKEKELLLKELHHRVKNNLQIVSSLLKLQSRLLKDENAIYAIQDSRNRVDAMAMIHEKLYQGNALREIPILEYVNNLISNVAASYGVPTEGIELDIKIENINMDVETAIPIGLILNELVSNAFKHAFINTPKPYLEIVLQITEQGYFIKVHDNGAGVPKDFDIKESKSFGMDLVASLISQLAGKINIYSEEGSSFEISIPKIEK